MTMLLALTFTAFAADLGEISIGADDFVRGHIVVDADPGVVRALLADSAAVAAASPEVRDARAIASGPCDRVFVEVKAPIVPLKVETLRCPTDDGWTEQMVASAAFDAWENTWSLTTLDDGRTRVDYAVRTEFGLLPLPRGAYLQRTARSIRHSLTVLGARADAGEI